MKVDEKAATYVAGFGDIKDKVPVLLFEEVAGSFKTEETSNTPTQTTEGQSQVKTEGLPFSSGPAVSSFSGETLSPGDRFRAMKLASLGERDRQLAQKGYESVQEFLELADMTPAERWVRQLRKQALDDLGLTEDSLAAMNPEERAEVERKIKEIIQLKIAEEADKKTKGADGSAPDQPDPAG